MAFYKFEIFMSVHAVINADVLILSLYLICLYKNLLSKFSISIPFEYYESLLIIFSISHSC